VRRVTVDGAEAADGRIPLRDDGRTHEVHVVLGAAEADVTSEPPAAKAGGELAAAG
jgi:hypothetical protein